MYDQPIVACATPRGEGAIAVVRISGVGAFQIADRCFKPVGSPLLSEAEERRMLYGIFFDFRNGARLVDRCMAVRFAGPRSFSGEDIVEFHLHGNPLIVDAAVSVCIDLGCRLAGPGEFSRRAFMNGKMDLAQAEALSEVIRAESEIALDLAQRQLGGALSSKFSEFRRTLIDVLALLELELDFVQEGYELIDYRELRYTLAAIADEADALLELYKSGDRLRRGPRILLLGRPNAGKSSLFNAFLGHSRSLVSDTPGTTRDYLEERIYHKGVLFHLLDTAGIRATEDALEAEGVSRAHDLIPLADHIFYLIDSTLPFQEQQGELACVAAFRSEFPHGTFLPVFTKSDKAIPPESHLSCSVIYPDTVFSLLDVISESYSSTISDNLALLSERQYHLLRRIKAQIESISLDSELPAEFLSADLRELLTPLSELTGEVTNEDILDSVFSGFCIGK